MADRGTVLASLVGKPYRERARGPDAFDCWGLVCFARPRLFGGPPLPDANIAPSDILRVGRAFAAPAHRHGWSALAPATPFCASDGAVVLMSRGDVPHHVGLWLGPERAMLHCCPAQRVVLDRLGHLTAAYWRITTILVPEDPATP